MANCAIVGINWGDEGKGRMVDLLASEYDVVVRYQGGNNAGHTVINQYGKFALHLIPSGIFRPEVINLLGNGTVIDPEALLEEMQSLQAAGYPSPRRTLRSATGPPLYSPTTGPRTPWRRSGSRTPNTAPPSGALRRYTAINSKRKPS